MIRRAAPVLLLLLTASIGALALPGAAPMPMPMPVPGASGDPAQIRGEIARARQQADAASRRGERLEVQARAARGAVEQTARQAAALAARIQQSEAGIGESEARLALIDARTAAFRQRLARRRAPLVRLTAALQTMALRPLLLSVLRPGSLRDTVYLRAVLETGIPEVRRRTAALRVELERIRALRVAAAAELGRLRARESELAERRRALAALETRQRLAARDRGGVAAREGDRALALAERARDLGALMEELDRAAALRRTLAALPGPLPRPDSPGRGGADVPLAPQETATADAAADTDQPAPPAPRLQLPVTGRIVRGFGAPTPAGQRSEGIAIAARTGAQVVAPAAGRIVFAGPYRGYGRIVIVEHDGGWTTLVTGLGRIDAAIGADVVAGAPLGVAGARDVPVTLELRGAGRPVNPLDHIG